MAAWRSTRVASLWGGLSQVAAGWLRRRNGSRAIRGIWRQASFRAAFVLPRYLAKAWTLL